MMVAEAARMAESGKNGPAGKKARLADELRANLARRKAQNRSRRMGGTDGRGEGIGAASDQPARPTEAPPAEEAD